MGHDSPSLDTASICDLDQHAMDQEPRTRSQGPGGKDRARRVIARTLQEPMTKSHGPGAKDQEARTMQEGSLQGPCSNQ